MKHSKTILIGAFLLSSVFLHPLNSNPRLGSCEVFPANNIWNTPIDTLPLHSLSEAYVRSIGTQKKLKADFGSGLWEGSPIGIPFILTSEVSPVAVSFEYSEESEPGPYPIPPNAPVEGGDTSNGDRHVLVLEQKTCKLYELYSARKKGKVWTAGSGAVFDLKSNRLRPANWTSADAAGLPILPGLVRHEEVASGEIKHAIRFTAKRTQKAYLWPARHYASKITDKNVPPMGTRFRLKADFNIEGFSKENQIILRALKKYGMILADNGSDWFLSGAPNENWNNDQLHKLGKVLGNHFEAVDSESLILSPDSGEARQN
ncbi:hypothetical protein [Leptospira alstonii]|uniref:Uncharacterized protein n=2 Tax=Leptospira alstonii TaxID=28452 RepID=M6D6F4_9LEPT|nr:hypothetical protein [Leptospira alstonii]EMJ94135.1 hypothetical protein LEP1GSC194_0209 [Leptospira alstonii serovar Sichuan str. 79601]EQA79266.1 hypothetical protein LEP1GSC193_2653 [Leptospira alstonii serovar Pingchang str. 80-412]